MRGDAGDAVLGEDCDAEVVSRFVGVVVPRPLPFTQGIGVLFDLFDFGPDFGFIGMFGSARGCAELNG